MRAAKLLAARKAHREVFMQSNTMITKGGFVGDKDSLVECVEYLFTKISTRKRPV